MLRRTLLAAAPFLAVAGCAQNPPAAAKTVVVFFTADSASLDAAAQAAIADAANTVKQRGGSTVVHVRGFAAPDAGSSAFSRSLSRTRAEAVADALVSAGVTRGQLSMESRGAVAYDLMPTESRRVEILIGT